MVTTVDAVVCCCLFIFVRSSLVSGQMSLRHARRMQPQMLQAPGLVQWQAALPLYIVSHLRQDARLVYNDIVWEWLCSEFSYELDSVKPMISLFAIEVLCNFRVNFLVWNTSSRGSYAISVDEESRELARLLIFLDYRIKLDRHSVVHNATRECSVILKSKTTKRIWKNMNDELAMFGYPLFHFLGCIQERTGSDRSASKTVIGTLKNSDSKMMMWTIEDLRSFKMFQDLPHWCTYSYSTHFNASYGQNTVIKCNKYDIGREWERRTMWSTRSSRPCRDRKRKEQRENDSGYPRIVDRYHRQFLLDERAMILMRDHDDKAWAPYRPLQVWTFIVRICAIWSITFSSM